MSIIDSEWVTPELLRIWLKGLLEKYRDAQKELSELRNELEATKKELKKCRKRYQKLRSWHGLKLEPAVPEDEEP